MENFLENLGLRLGDRRKQCRLTQDDLAEKAGVTSQMISTAELGKKSLRPENILKLCAVLEISTDYLLRGVVTDVDLSLLSRKILTLTPKQFRRLEEITKNFIAAVNERETIEIDSNKIGKKSV